MASQTTQTLIDPIISGIAAGVATGLILALIFYIFNRFNKAKQRRDEVRHLRQVIVAFQQEILNAADVTIGAPIPVPVAEIRWAHLKNTHEEVLRALDLNAATLSYQEKKQIVDAFGLYETFKKGGTMGLEHDQPIGPVQYHEIFDNIESIEWLSTPVIDRTNLPRNNEEPEQ